MMCKHCGGKMEFQEGTWICIANCLNKMTPPNTELKSAGEWINIVPKTMAGDTCVVYTNNLAELIRSIQHNAMLHAAETVKKQQVAIGQGHVTRDVCVNAILTRAEQILKGEK